MPFLSERDKSDLLFGIEQKVDYVAASFTRRAQDIIDMRSFLNSHGGEGICSHELTYDCGVHHVVKLLENHAEQQRQPLSLPAEVHHRGHDKAAEDSQHQHAPETGRHPLVDNGRRHIDQLGLAVTHGDSHQSASHDIAQQHDGQLLPVLRRGDKTADPCVQLQLVVDNGKETERKQYGPDDTAGFQESHSS